MLDKNEGNRNPCIGFIAGRIDGNSTVTGCTVTNSQIIYAEREAHVNQSDFSKNNNFETFTQIYNYKQLTQDDKIIVQEIENELKSPEISYNKIINLIKKIGSNVVSHACAQLLVQHLLSLFPVVGTLST